MKVGVDEYDRLLRLGKFDPSTLTWIPAHYSSERMKNIVMKEFARRGIDGGRPEMWYSNLTSVGNIGSASIYVILDEMMEQGLIKDGDTMLCMVPESGRFAVRTCISPRCRRHPGRKPDGDPAFEAAPTEQLRRRAVVYLYTQTGQLLEVAQALTAPLEARGWDIRWIGVQPRDAFPFPWPIRRLFGVFLQVVDPEALVELVEPAGGFERLQMNWSSWPARCGTWRRNVCGLTIFGSAVVAQPEIGDARTTTL